MSRCATWYAIWSDRYCSRFASILTISCGDKHRNNLRDRSMRTSKRSHPLVKGTGEFCAINNAHKLKKMSVILRKIIWIASCGEVTVLPCRPISTKLGYLLCDPRGNACCSVNHRGGETGHSGQQKPVVRYPSDAILQPELMWGWYDVKKHEKPNACNGQRIEFYLEIQAVISQVNFEMEDLHVWIQCCKFWQTLHMRGKHGVAACVKDKTPLLSR